MTNDELLLGTIRSLRFLLMAGIVFIHLKIKVFQIAYQNVRLDVAYTFIPRKMVKFQ